MIEKRLIERKNKLSQWVSIYEDKLIDINGEIDLYHAISVPDYVCILAVDGKGYVPLVRQYRHAVNEVTLELPAGLVANQTPEKAALNELLEETGYQSSTKIKELISLRPCTGRLSNRCWCFFLDNISKNNAWIPEKGVQLEMKKATELIKLIENGEIDNSMHVATILKAINNKLI